MRNFAFPYFSRGIAEFWRKWHISLSTWFRDYLYIPLGGSKGGTFMKIRNTFIIFFVSGFWHGANWTFIIWGLINALYFLPLLLLNKNRINTDIVAQNKIIPNIKESFQILFTFILTLIAWIFFRSKSVYDAFAYIYKAMSYSLFSRAEIFPKKIILFVFLFVIAEWLQKEKQHALQLNEFAIPKIVRWSIYNVLIWMILYFGGNQQEFIYFQF